MKKYCFLILFITTTFYSFGQQVVTDSVVTELGDFILETSENEFLSEQDLLGDSTTTSDGGNAEYLIGIENGTFRIQNPTQTENNSESFSLLPNPTAGIVEVKLVGMNSTITFSILDPLGRIVMYNSLFVQGDRTIHFDMTEYARGVYFVQVITQNSTFTQRLIRE